ncbi:hypothetical protein BC832DRAFT_558508 [Gaertneriomyces semiglobifer]|nr:hypothetical protein BC832DRAFT_558508 [Gaertneriomyces semiglobifer]
MKSPEELLKTVGSDPWITYGPHLEHDHHSPSRPSISSNDIKNRFIPSFVAFDKTVLRFNAYFKVPVFESSEQYHLHRVKILYYVEDDSIAVVEPPVENSGMMQGVLVKRQRLPKEGGQMGEYLTAKDFNLGIDVTVYGKTMHIVSCDEFTEKYMAEVEKIQLNPPEPMPVDQHELHRSRPVRLQATALKQPDKLKRFLEHDRKVLRFYCLWDDRQSMFGELREFVLHYYLVDDSVEVREIRGANSGRSEGKVLVRRMVLPKSSTDQTSRINDVGVNVGGEILTWRDFKIGGIINILGRAFLVRDCDTYTRQFYLHNTKLSSADLAPLTLILPNQHQPKHTQPIQHIESKSAAFLRLLENEHKILRFSACLVSPHKEDTDRRFVISFRLADGRIGVYESLRQNAGTISGKFLDPTLVPHPDAPASTGQFGSGDAISGDMAGMGRYYTAEDLYVGATLYIFKHKFRLLDADEFVFKYQSDPKYIGLFPYSDPTRVIPKLKDLLQLMNTDSVSLKAALSDVFHRIDSSQTGSIPRDAFVSELKTFLKTEDIVEHELITFARHYERSPRKVDYGMLLNDLFPEAGGQ